MTDVTRWFSPRRAAGEPATSLTPTQQPSDPVPAEQAPAEQSPTEPASVGQAQDEPPGEESDGGRIGEETGGDRLPAKPGFGERGRMRRRARFLRKARELAYRDLGGLVFDLHRFGQRNDQIVLAKLATLGQIDSELRAIEQALHEIRPVTVLREVGIGACPRCAALHGSEDRFCPGCGMAFAASAERPLSTTPVGRGAPGAQQGAQEAAHPLRPGARDAHQGAHETAAPADPDARAMPAVPATPGPLPAPPQPPPQLAPGGTPSGEHGRERFDEEPTQILRPPSTGA